MTGLSLRRLEPAPSYVHGHLRIGFRNVASLLKFVVVACECVTSLSTALDLQTEQLAPREDVRSDILLRTPEQKESVEQLYREAVAHRLGPLLSRGYKTHDVHLGWGSRVRVQRCKLRRQICVYHESRL
jgi:hypothetical protein